MFKFIRRLFVILILIVVVFLVYRYINPNGASRIMDKIKSIPTTISSWFSKDDSEFVLDSKTISLTWDLQVINSGENLKKDSEENDKLWLETLNKEIESILWKDKKEVVVDETILTGTKEIIANSWSDSVKSSSGIDVIVSSWSSVENIISNSSGDKLDKENKKETVISTSTVKNAITKTTNKLTNFDYQQIKNVFGNLFK